MHPKSVFRIPPNQHKLEKWQWLNFIDMMSLPSFFKVIIYLLPSLDIDSSFSSISVLVLELRQFSFLRDLTRNKKILMPGASYNYYHRFYFNTRNRFYWVTFKLENTHRRKFCTMTLFMPLDRPKWCTYNFYHFWFI